MWAALGRGQRLFADGTIPTALRHIDSRTTSTGISVQVYQPEGRPTYGTYELEEG